MSNKSEQIVEQLLGAINILAEAEIKKSTKYDTTQNAEVIDATERDIGKYWVSPDGKTRYVAYCDPTEAQYRAKDKVRVAIPQSDYSNKKYIVGKQYDDGTGVVNYVSPLESTFFPDAETNRWTKIISSTIRPTYFNGILITPLGTLTNIEPKYNIRDIYNVLAIKFNVCVDEYLYTITSGTYGVKILLHCEQGNYECEALSSDMIGNPYTFMVPSPQVFKFNISPEWGEIKSIEFKAYQSGEFKYLSGNKEEVLPRDKVKFIISDLYCSFGGDLSSTDNFTLKIFPADNPNGTDKIAGTPNYYLYNYDDNSERYVGLQWINMSEDGEYIGFSDGRVVKKEYIDRNENSTQTLDNNTIASYQNNKRDYYQHYDEIKYREELKKNEELLSALKENYPTNKKGLELIIQYNEVQNKLTQIEKNITEIMGKIKSYQGLFSRSSGLNNELSDKIDTYLTYRDNFADYGQKLCETLDNGIKNEYNNKIKGEAYNSPIEFDKDIFPRLGNLWLTLQSFDLIGTGNREDDFYKNEISTLYSQLWNEKIKDLEPGFTDCKDAINTALSSSEDDLSPYVSLLSQTEWIENNANFYSLYWYVKDEKQTGDLIAGDGWRAVYADYGSQSLCLPHTCKDGFLNIYPEKVSTGMTPNKTKQTRVIKAVLVYNHTTYHSNEITFINAVNIDGILTDSGDGLKINHRDNSKDAYTEYGQYRKLKNIGAANTKRIIDVTYETDDYGNEILNNTTINWYIPISNTMLRPPSSDDLTNLGLTQATTSDRPGYYKYTGKIYFSKDDQSFIKDDKQTNQFCYYIKNNFNNLAQDNSIICEVIKSDGKKYERALPLSFSTAGTNGLPYTLIIEPVDKITYDNDEENGYNLRVSLYNDKDEQIQILSSNLTVTPEFWKGGSEFDIKNKPGFGQHTKTEEGLSVIVNIKRNSLEEGQTTYYHNGYAIFSFTLSNLQHKYEFVNSQGEKEEKTVYYELSEKYAIPFCKENYYIEGIDRLVYDMSGRLITDESDATPYRLFDRNTGQEVTNYNGSEITWAIGYYTDIGLKSLGANPGGLPTLSNKNVLIGANMYIEHSTPYYAVVIAQYKRNQNIGSLWVQPIIIQQDVYGSTLLNEWPGQLVIDEKGNTIMSAMVGAGIKNSDNTFSGVLMGQVSAKAGITPPSSKGDTVKGIGLYGIHKGAFSYGFNVEGTAFLGKSGGGRIWFDGTNSIIASAQYLTTQNNGVMIDLDDNELFIGDQNKNSYLHYIDGDLTISLGTGNDLTIGDNSLIEILENMELSSDEIKEKLKGTPETGGFFKANDQQWYLSANYILVKDTNSTVVFEADGQKQTVELAGWTVTADSFTKNNFGQDSAIHLYSTPKQTTFAGQSDKWMFVVGTNFGITKEGNIVANGGLLGGVNIDSNGIGTSKTYSIERIFYANMLYTKNNTGKMGIQVSNYSTDINSAWRNDVYLIDKLNENSTNIIYFSDYYYGSEIFITKSTINHNTNDEKSDLYDCIFHGYCRDYEDGLDLSSYKNQNYRLIINYKKTPEAKVLSAKNTFRIDSKTGQLIATGAKLSGDVQVRELRANEAIIANVEINNEYIRIGGLALENSSLSGYSGLRINGTVPSATGQNPHSSFIVVTMKGTHPYILWDPGYGNTIKELDLTTLFN